MQIRLLRQPGGVHRVEVERADGSRDRAVLDSRSMLVHDLVHFAVESELGLSGGFWGSLARGRSFAELRAAPFGDDAGLARAERLVGPMQSVFRGRMSPAAYLAVVHEGRSGLGPVSPEDALLDAAFVAAVLERMRRLWGHWQGTGFHEPMCLTWPPARP